MASINLNSILKKHKQLKYTIVPEGGLAVLHESAEIITLNPLASEILDKIDGKKRVVDILKEILKDYKVEEKEAEKDLIEFLKVLYEKKMIEIL